MPHVFVSYVRDNTPEVECLVRDLRLAGVEVWYDRDSLKAGSYWAEAIVAGIESGGFFLACFSKEYASRERTYMDEELVVARAMLAQHRENRSWLIPLLLNGCTPGGVGLVADPVLGALHCVSMSPEWADGIRRILETVSPERSFGRCLNELPAQQQPVTKISAPLLALDFGTSQSLLAYRGENLEWVAIRGADGRSFHSSVATFADNWDYWVCAEAADAATRRPERSVAHIKRLLARGDEVSIGHKRFDAVTVASLVIRHMRDCAERQLGVPVERVVASVPADYSRPQKAALVRACERAGLTVVRLIAEPNAAALLTSDWLRERPDLSSRKNDWDTDVVVLVVDVGGGTTDVSIVEVASLEDDRNFEVLVTIGDNELGGMDYDAAIHRFIRESIIDPLICKGMCWTPIDDQRLLLYARQAKEALSRSEHCAIVMPDVETRPGQLETLSVDVDRASLTGAVRLLDARLHKLIDGALSAIGQGQVTAEPRTIGAVLLGGQGSKLWTIAQSLQSRFVGIDIETRYQENAVSLGLSSQCAVLDGRRGDLLLIDATTRGVGMRYWNELAATDNKLDPTHEISLSPDKNKRIASLVSADSPIPTKGEVTFRARGPGHLGIDLLELDRTEQPTGLLSTLQADLPVGDSLLQLVVDIDANDKRIYRLLDRERQQVLDEQVLGLS